MQIDRSKDKQHDLHIENLVGYYRQELTSEAPRDHVLRQRAAELRRLGVDVTGHSLPGAHQ